MDYAQLIIIAILVEAIWENLKILYDKMLVCVLAQIDIFALVGITLKLPIVGYVLTGIICSRGSNAINDLLGKLKGE